MSAIKRTIKEAALPTAEWLRHDEALAEASTRRAAVEKELLDKRTELEGLRRTQQALPLIGQRRRLREQLVPLVQTPRLSPEFSDRRRDVTADLKAARTTIERISQSFTKTADAIRAMAIPTPLLSRAEAIEQLHRDFGALHQGSAGPTDTGPSTSAISQGDCRAFA